MKDVIAYLAELPGWFVAAIIVAAGWLAAIVARTLLARMLAALRFNRLCDRAGVCDFLRKGEVPLTPSQLVGWGIHWGILIVSLMEAARLIHIAVAAELRHRLVAAIPPLLSAAFVLAAGLLVVAFLAGFVRTVFRNAGSAYATLWSRIARTVGVLLVLAVACEQADMRGSMLASAMQIVLAAIAFGAALAFGLGCKDMARNAMEKLIAELRDRHKDGAKSDMEG